MTSLGKANLFLAFHLPPCVLPTGVQGVCARSSRREHPPYRGSGIPIVSLRDLLKGLKCRLWPHLVFRGETKFSSKQTFSRAFSTFGHGQVREGQFRQPPPPLPLPPYKRLLNVATLRSYIFVSFPQITLELGNFTNLNAEGAIFSGVCGSCSSRSEEKSPMARFPDPKQY